MSNEIPFNQSPVNYSPDPPQAPVAYRLDLEKLFNDVWNLYKQNFGKMIIISLIMLSIMYGVTAVMIVIGNVFEQKKELWHISFAFQCFQQLISSILNVWLLLGMLQIMLAIARGRESRYSMMFPSIGKTLKSVGVTIMMVLIVYLPLLFVGGIMVAAWFLWGNFESIFGTDKQIDNATITLLIISGLLGLLYMLYAIYMTMRLTLTFSFIADRNNGVFASLNNSWIVTRGNVLSLFAGMFVLWLCAVSGMLLCLVGIILTYAVAPAGIVLAYLQITGQPNICDYQRSIQQNPMPPLYIPNVVEK